MSNYWFRWFTVSFLTGMVALPMVLIFSPLLGIFFSSPIMILSNPFVATTSRTVALSGGPAMVVISLCLGIALGFIGLAAATVKKLLWR